MTWRESRSSEIVTDQESGLGSGTGRRTRLRVARHDISADARLHRRARRDGARIVQIASRSRDLPRARAQADARQSTRAGALRVDDVIPAFAECEIRNPLRCFQS